MNKVSIPISIKVFIEFFQTLDKMGYELDEMELTLHNSKTDEIIKFPVIKAFEEWVSKEIKEIKK